MEEGRKSRKSPEDFLREVQAEETAAVRRGHLKIFLGYASGVGKTVRMLDEARRRRERGQDVVVGAIQPEPSPEAKQILNVLEVIPLKIVGDGRAMDVEQLIRRHPAICIVDGLAYDNPRGAPNAARWQDVLDLVAAGVKVIGSINIQYIEEIRQEVEAVTGKHVTQTVPISFIQSADEIEIVDAPTEGLDSDERRSPLAKLREMALVLTADVIDRQLSKYLECQGIHQHFGTQERILVSITPRANVQDMIETAQMIADRFHGELIVAYVSQPQISAFDQETLNKKLEMARVAGAAIQILEGEDPIEAIVTFARERGITQLFIGHTQRTGLWHRMWGNPVEKLIRMSRGMDVRIFPQ